MEIGTVMKVWDLRLVTSHCLRHPMFNEIFFYHPKWKCLFQFYWSGSVYLHTDLFFSVMILLLQNGQVVMRSGDAELEMRGRCSAGQKVKSFVLQCKTLKHRILLGCRVFHLTEVKYLKYRLSLSLQFDCLLSSASVSCFCLLLPFATFCLLLWFDVFVFSFSLMFSVS